MILSYLPWLTVGSGYNVSLSDQHAAAFVLGKKPQPCGFPYQHLPWPFAECRTRSADDPAAFPH